ncbi:MAG TPA: hypothetical protein VM889_02120 [Candidatus Thermoplasmatota archaeon]|nr:hypothetical protein [Candidatus Thermoplasmatota archaeon]
MAAKPDLDAFTPRERALVERLATPRAVQRWLETVPYNKEKEGPTCRSFRGVVRAGTAHCLEAAVSAAVILEQRGFPPTLLSIDSRDGLGHAVLLFEDRGRWGAVSRSRYPGLHGRRPVFRSVRDLAWSYFDPFVDYTGEITGYAVVDLAEAVRGDWRLAKRHVWRVERALVEAPHTRLRASRARVRRLRSWYKAWKAENPDDEPPFYPGHERWL